MYVKVLQNCIFAILIFSSKGFPQENILHENVTPNKEPPEIVPLNKGPPENVQPETAPLDVPHKKILLDEAPPEDGNVSPEDDDVSPENIPPDNEGNEKPANRLPNREALDNVDYIPDNKFQDYSNYGGPSEGSRLPLHLPTSNEMLDRNKPEAGFDLTYDEMMKLKLWPDAFIPYFIDVHSYSDKVLRDKIRSLLSSVNSLTSLNFVELPSPPKDDSRWVLFMNRRGLLGCADHSIKNFTNTGVQLVVLGYHCMSTEGELAEAVLAIAGVPPQHNAPDRDYYIKINEKNIMPEKKYLFEKLTDDEWLFHDLEYDFKSVGHFHSYKYSINGHATIEPQTQTKDLTIGESKSFTAKDIQKIRMLYNYIVKKNLLKTPDCHKLFEPGKKFNQYKPNDNNLKPRPKPYKYAGELADTPVDIDEQEENVPNLTLNQDGEVENLLSIEDEPNTAIGEQLPNYTNQIDQIPGENESHDINEVGKNKLTYDDTDKDYDKRNKYLLLQNISIVYKESENFSHSNFRNEDKTPAIITTGQESKTSLKHKIPLKEKISLDTLSFISDYGDDERANADETKIKYKRPLKKKISQDTLSFISDYGDDERSNADETKMLQLKFKPVGTE